MVLKLIRWALLLALLGVLAQLAWLAWPSPPIAVQASVTPLKLNDQATIERGRYLAVLGNCQACHTTRGNPPYAGGPGILTPFGTIHGGNLTPGRNGLAEWNADDFWRALHHGQSRDGRLLSPAFPYNNMSWITRRDSDALYAYLHSLPRWRRRRRHPPCAGPITHSSRSRHGVPCTSRQRHKTRLRC